MMYCTNKMLGVYYSRAPGAQATKQSAIIIYYNIDRTLHAL